MMMMMMIIKMMMIIMIMIMIAQVRHISGQHVKEFKDFLARYPDEFVVKEEIVFLKVLNLVICSIF